MRWGPSIAISQPQSASRQTFGGMLIRPCQRTFRCWGYVACAGLGVRFGGGAEATLRSRDTTSGKAIPHGQHSNIHQTASTLRNAARGRRRQDLERRWATSLDTFADTIATYDFPAARATARLLVEGMEERRPMSLADAQIAGICLANAATLPPETSRTSPT